MRNCRQGGRETSKALLVAPWSAITGGNTIIYLRIPYISSQIFFRIMTQIIEVQHPFRLQGDVVLLFYRTVQLLLVMQTFQVSYSQLFRDKNTLTTEPPSYSLSEHNIADPTMIAYSSKATKTEQKYKPYSA